MASTNSSKILVLFAHPTFENSRVQRTLLRAAEDVAGVWVHDLYQLYPDFDIDVEAEQRLLVEHDVLVLQHPFYWYSAPPLVKQWLDLVLEYGWAYGSGGDALQGKRVFQVLSAGGGEASYTQSGRNRHTIRDFLLPFEQTALLCGMQYLAPFVVHSTHGLSDETLQAEASAYKKLLETVRATKPSKMTDSKGAQPRSSRDATDGSRP